jgi:hypothetical protein
MDKNGRHIDKPSISNFLIYNNKLVATKMCVQGSLPSNGNTYIYEQHNVINLHQWHPIIEVTKKYQLAIGEKFHSNV